MGGLHKSASKSGIFTDLLNKAKPRNIEDRVMRGRVIGGITVYRTRANFGRP